MSSYKIVNPSAGDDFYDLAGNAISSQPNVNAGSALNLGSNRTLLDNINFGKNKHFDGGKVVQTLDVARANLASNSTGVSGVTVESSGGYAFYKDLGSGLGDFTAGTWINVQDANEVVDGPQKVVGVSGTDGLGFRTNKLYTSGAATNVTLNLPTGNFATMTEGEFIMQMVTTKVAGLDRDLRSTAKGKNRRSIHKVESGTGRTYKVATAIRQGGWNEYTGQLTGVTNANDSIGNVAGSTVTDGSADHAVNSAYTAPGVPGELVYLEGGPTPTQDDYEAKNG